MEKHLNRIKAAWFFMTFKPQKAEEPKVTPKQLIEYLPAAGFLTGIASWIIAEASIFFYGGGIKSAFLAAMIITVGYCILTRGRELNSLTWSGDLIEAWQEEHYEKTPVTRYYGLFLIGIIMLCRLAVITLIISKGQHLWVLAAPVVAALSLSYSLSATGDISFSSGAPRFKEMWLISGAILLIPAFGLGLIIPMLLSILICYFADQYLRKYLLSKLKQINKELAYSIAAVVHTLAYITVLFLIK